MPSLPTFKAEPVDPSRSAPLYHQVEADLRQHIAAGTLAPGMALPPEEELRHRYGVSRQTMRKALQRLTADGLITRTAGRGTFIAPQADRTRFYLDRSFTQQMAELGQQAHSKVLRRETGTLSAEDPVPLHAHVGAPCLRLARLRYGNEMPVGLQYTTLRTDELPDLGSVDFASTSLYDVLARIGALEITEIEHTISAAAATTEHARLLRVPIGDPLLVVGTTAFLANRDPIEHTVSYYRPDRYEYQTRHRAQ